MKYSDSGCAALSVCHSRIKLLESESLELIKPVDKFVFDYSFLMDFYTEVCAVTSSCCKSLFYSKSLSCIQTVRFWRAYETLP